MTSSRIATVAPVGVDGSDAALVQGWSRLARAGVLGGVSLLLAAAGHTVGGGTLPGAGLLILVGVGLALVAVSLTARRLRFGTLLAVLTVQQLGLHLLFHAATIGSACAAVAMQGHSAAGQIMAGHGMSAPLMAGHAMPAAVCAAGSPAVGGWSMLLGHVLAVLATAWLLARGESWLWRTVDRLHRYATTRPARFRRPRAQETVGYASESFLVPRLTPAARAPPVA